MITALGRVRPVPRGDFSLSAVYESLDIVFSGGASFIAKHNAPFTGIPLSNLDYWQLLVSSFSGSSAVNDLYPIGIVISLKVSISPATLFPGTTWEAIPEGTFLMAGGATKVPGGGLNSGYGGSATHTLTEAELPNAPIMSDSGYYMRLSVGGYALPASGSTKYTLTGTISDSDKLRVGGSGAAHNNLPPYRTYYMWERTA